MIRLRQRWRRLWKVEEKAAKPVAGHALIAAGKKVKLTAPKKSSESGKASGKEAAKEVKEAGKDAARGLKKDAGGDSASGATFTASDVKDVAAMAAKHSAQEVVSILRGEDAKREMKGKKLNETLEKATHVPAPKHDPAISVKAAIQKAVITSMSPGKDTDFD